MKVINDTTSVRARRTRATREEFTPELPVLSGASWRIWATIITIGAILAAIALFAAPAAAQGGGCTMNRAGLVQFLADEYGKSLAATGLQLKGNLIEIYVSAETRTWTIIEAAPDGMTCLRASGTMWEAVVPEG